MVLFFLLLNLLQAKFLGRITCMQCIDAAFCCRCRTALSMICVCECLYVSMCVGHTGELGENE